MNRTDRDHVRIKMDTRVFVEVMAADDTSEAVLAQCDVVDVSYGGFSASIQSEVPIGAFLSVCVELPGVADPFFMVAEVKWCRANEDDQNTWLVGFKLVNSNDTDIDSWRALLEHV
ncbi:MAG: PilZ domain-containing protein [Halioglobus sp.]